MGDWLLNLPIPWMALVIFAAVYLVTAAIYLTVIRLAVGDRARAFKALSPGMLPPLGIIFGLLVGFVAVQVWNDFDRAKIAVASEASALRGVGLLAESFPEEQRSQLRALINRHIQEAVQQEWPAMAEQRATLATLPQALAQCLEVTLNLKPADEGQATAQREIVNFLGKAADARRQRIIISQSSVSSVKCAAVLLIATYTRPFTGDISVGPDLLQQVITSEPAMGASVQ